MKNAGQQPKAKCYVDITHEYETVHWYETPH
jgi:hypothetical protein